MNNLPVLLLCLVAYITNADAHGAMTNPPARNTQVTFWDYKGVDWNSGSSGTNSGFKGSWMDPRVTSVCGAPAWDEPGPVLATYTAGSVISVEIAISAPHGGYHEFRICDRSVSDKASLASCLLNGPLLKRVNPLPAGSTVFYPEHPPKWNAVNLATRWRAPSLSSGAPKDLNNQDGTSTGKTFKSYPIYKLDYKLPEGFTCNKCIFSWFYQSTNSAGGGGNDLDDVQGERFWNCADIKIVGGGNSKPPVKPPSENPPPVVTPPSKQPPPAVQPPKVQPPKVQPPPQASTGFRCGNDWSDADNNCKKSCVTNDDCSGGETCYADVQPCKVKKPGVITRGPTRCGKDWMRAKSSCKPDCSTNADCHNGEYCFGGLGDCSSKLIGDDELELAVPDIQLGDAEEIDAAIAEEVSLGLGEEAVVEEVQALAEEGAMAADDVSQANDDASQATVETAQANDEVFATVDVATATEDVSQANVESDPLAVEDSQAVAQATEDISQATVEVTEANIESDQAITEAQATVDLAQANQDASQAVDEVTAATVEVDTQANVDQANVESDPLAVEDSQAVAQATEDISQATVEVTEANIESDQAVTEAQATVDLAQANQDASQAVVEVASATIEDSQANVDVAQASDEAMVVDEADQAQIDVAEQASVEDQAVAEHFEAQSAEAIDGDFATIEADFATQGDEANSEDSAAAAGDSTNTLADRSARNQLAPYQVGLIVVVCVTIVVTIVVVLSVQFVNKRKSERA